MRDSSFADQFPERGVIAATRLYKGGGTATPPAPPPPPSQVSAADNVKAKKSASAQMKRQGFESTILTSGLGVSTPGDVQSKTLLGS